MEGMDCCEKGLPMESEVIEEFWGVELTKDQKTAKWDVDDEEDLSCTSNSTLQLSQACLGPGAKEKERNIVQVTVDDGTGKTATFSIVSLRAGLMEQAMVPLNLNPPVVFKLVEGSGPVSLVGTTSDTISLGDDDSDDDDDESEEEEVTLGVPQKRAAPPGMKPPASKVAKKGNELDTSMKSEDAENEDDDDDEYDDDEDEDEDDSDKDEDDDEEIEEEPKPVIPKKAKINGKPKTPLKEKPIKSNTSKTPQPLQKTKLLQKGSSSVPPKSAPEKKKIVEKKAVDINEIKKKLTKMTVPKKIDKFNNFVSNSFKIKDDAVKKELWEHVQKSRS